MKPEQILDLSSGQYDKIQKFFDRSLTSKEKYELEKSLLQVHIKYSNILDELEYIIQRRLNEQELRTLVGDKYHEIEKRLGKSLTEKQLRNILHGKYDQSLIEVEDLLNHSRRKYEDNYKRTQTIATRLIEKLEQDYNKYKKESTVRKSLKSSSHRSSIQEKQSNVEFHQTTTELLEQLSNDVRKHAIVPQQDSLLDSYSSEILDHKSISSNDELKTEDQSLSNKGSVSSTESIKAFENIKRIVEQIADKEHIEEMTTVTNAIEKLQEKHPKNGMIVFVISK
jgi:hypothetical protein